MRHEKIRAASFDPRLQAITQDSEKINHVDDPRIAIDGADFIYTDTWIDMQFFNDPEKKAEKAALLTKMQPFQVNESLIEGHDLMIMHDMPIHNDYEITPGLVRDPRSRTQALGPSSDPRNREANLSPTHHCQRRSKEGELDCVPRHQPQLLQS